MEIFQKENTQFTEKLRDEKRIKKQAHDMQ